MSLNGSSQQKNKKRGSQNESPEKRFLIESPDGSPEVKGMVLFPDNSATSSPENRCLLESPNRSELKGIVLFADYPNSSPLTRGSPSKMSPKRSPQGSVTKKASKLRRGIDLFGNKATTPPKEEFPFSPATYTVDFRKRVSGGKVRSPLPEFFESLKNNGSISKTTDLPPMGKKICDCSGSFFDASFMNDEVVKTASLGLTGTIDKKDLEKLMNATALCSGNPDCAEVLSFHINHRDAEKEATVTIVQKRYHALKRNDTLPFLMCIISLLRTYIPQGFCPTDLKFGNFGMGDDGFVRWFDYDFKPVDLMKACVFIKSGEFQHSGNPEFQRFILMLMEFYCPIGLDRKQEFGELNDKKGLLQSLGLLSSEKSISETTIQDFREVLENIGLFEEDIAYLVGLIVPPPSSQ